MAFLTTSEPTFSKKHDIHQLLLERQELFHTSLDKVNSSEHAEHEQQYKPFGTRATISLTQTQAPEASATPSVP